MAIGREIVFAKRRDAADDRQRLAALTALALCAIALASAGCGGREQAAARSGARDPRQAPTQEFAGARGDAAAVIAGYETAIREGDTTRVCNAILILGPSYGRTEKRRQRLCASASGDLAQEVSMIRGDKRFGLSVLQIRVHQRSATAQVSVSEAGRSRIEPFFLHKRAGRWRLAARGFQVREGRTLSAALDCHGHQLSYAPAMVPLEAPNARAYVALVLRGMAPRALNVGSLFLLGVDYEFGARIFEYRLGGTRRLARFRESGVSNPYSLDGVDLCVGANGLSQATRR